MSSGIPAGARFRDERLQPHGPPLTDLLDPGNPLHGHRRPDPGLKARPWSATGFAGAKV